MPLCSPSPYRLPQAPRAICNYTSFLLSVKSPHPLFFLTPVPFCANHNNAHKAVPPAADSLEGFATCPMPPIPFRAVSAHLCLAHSFSWDSFLERPYLLLLLVPMLILRITRARAEARLLEETSATSIAATKRHLGFKTPAGCPNLADFIRPAFRGNLCYCWRVVIELPEFLVEYGLPFSLL